MPSSVLELKKNGLDTENTNSHALNQIAKSNAYCENSTKKKAAFHKVRKYIFERYNSIHKQFNQAFWFNLDQPLQVLKTIEFSNIWQSMQS